MPNATTPSPTVPGLQAGEDGDIQDAGDSLPGQVPVYHTHGLRQHLGTCKLHKRSDCPHLRHWRPGSRAGGKIQLGKILIREWFGTYEDVPKFARCRTCFRV